MASITASRTLMELRSPDEASIRSATALIPIFLTFFSGGVAGAVDIESAHFIGRSHNHPTNHLILLSPPYLVKAQAKPNLNLSHHH
jgi:hypothetical protein